MQASSKIYLSLTNGLHLFQALVICYITVFSGAILYTLLSKVYDQKKQQRLQYLKFMYTHKKTHNVINCCYTTRPMQAAFCVPWSGFTYSILLFYGCSE